MHTLRILFVLLLLTGALYAQNPTVRYNKTTGSVVEPSTFWAESHATAPYDMPALAVNTDRTLNRKSISANETFTFSAEPPDNTWFSVLVIETGGVTRTLTIPSSISTNRGIAITTLRIPAGTSVLLTWWFDGTNYYLLGEPMLGTLTTTKQTASNYTIGTTDADEAYGGVIYVTAAATITAPAVQNGMSFTVVTIGNVAVSVDVDAADLIVLDGTALADGDKATNASTSGDIIVFTYYDNTGWFATSNGWVDGN